jgi:hypothetical protein
VVNMAAIKLGFNGTSNGVSNLPLVCMKCGAAATVIKNHRFLWYPLWIWFFAIFGGWPIPILALILMRWARVEVPFCPRHQHHFRMRWLAVLGLGAVVGLGGLGVLAAAYGAPNDEPLFTALCVVWFVGSVICGLAAATVAGFTMIVAIRITDCEIQLANVSPRFVRAFEDAALGMKG